ncbi:hypothetical protein [Paracoccus versutus]|uniref:Phage tail protein n=1 Tax=Paracoccus versutus TaxID=34007 RepID=A0A3D9XAA4_PARVE|nr:hypothetical protein [Paracoccus versutus]REF67394.1 hypothetical protein BDD41_4419 [Paracoccus versutus]WGR58646.1 hypothetical protein E3U25_22340 [Paracoccus versutus]
MLYPTAGSRLYIADASGAVKLPESGWVEIGETEAIGMLGVEWETVDATNLTSPDGAEELIKGIIRRPPMQIVLGNDPGDAGQLLLWQASRSRDPFPFRLVLPCGGRWRGWFGLVTGLFEVFDTANSIMKLQADVLPTSKTFRSEDA